MTSPRVALSDLAQFTLLSIELGNGDARFAGSFTHLKAVREGFGWLYVSRADSIRGKLTTLDPVKQTAVFVALAPKAMPQVGDTFPYVGGPRNPTDVARILEGPESWQRVAFRPSDAIEIRDPEHPGTILQRKATVSDDPKEESKSVRMREAGWDHEHCELCWAKVGHGGATHGYESVEGRWLCEGCYAEYVIPRDLAFLYRGQ